MSYHIEINEYQRRLIMSIAGQKDKSFRSCDDCALAPWH